MKNETEPDGLVSAHNGASEEKSPKLERKLENKKRRVSKVLASEGAKETPLDHISGQREKPQLPRALKLLGRPPLIEGERLRDFNEFLRELAIDVNPQSLVEWLVVDEIARLKWIALRLRRAEAGFFEFTLKDKKSLTQINLAAGLNNQMDRIERAHRLAAETERRCDALFRNLERLQAHRLSKGHQKTIDLKAEEVVVG